MPSEKTFVPKHFYAIFLSPGHGLTVSLQKARSDFCQYSKHYFGNSGTIFSGGLLNDFLHILNRHYIFVCFFFTFFGFLNLISFLSYLTPAEVAVESVRAALVKLPGVQG